MNYLLRMEVHDASKSMQDDCCNVLLLERFAYSSSEGNDRTHVANVHQNLRKHGGSMLECCLFHNYPSIASFETAAKVIDDIWMLAGAQRINFSLQILQVNNLFVQREFWN